MWQNGSRKNSRPPSSTSSERHIIAVRRSSQFADRRGSQIVAVRSIDPFEHSWNPPSPPHDLNLIIPFRQKVSCGKTLRYAVELFCGIALNLSEPKRGRETAGRNLEAVRRLGRQLRAFGTVLVFQQMGKEP